MDARDIQVLTAVKLYYGESVARVRGRPGAGRLRPTVSKLLHLAAPGVLSVSKSTIPGRGLQDWYAAAGAFRSD